MNADTYLLLNTVLADRPCLDRSLDATIDTVPFAVHVISQQCYYVLYLRSTVHSLLTEDLSAYNVLVKYIAEQQDLQYQAQIGLICVSDHLSKDRITTSPPPVVPAGSLEIRVVLIGGGTVASCILRTLLDTHPDLIHPSRITVISRQPDNLHFMASQGVRCLKHTKGRRAIRDCDVLILACQAPHLQNVMEDHFWVVPTKEDPDPPAVLKKTTLVFSCVAAYPTAKLSSMLKHDESLIIRADVPTPSRLPLLAAPYVAASKQCVALQVQRMANHDSFLKTAVEEAHTIAVEALAGEILQARAATATHDTITPEGIEERAAHTAALQTIHARHVAPSVPPLLLDKSPPSRGFLGEVWAGLQHIAESAARTQQRDKGRAAEQAHHASGTGAVSVTDATNETALLCCSLAALPATRHTILSEAIMHKYGLRPTKEVCEETAETEAALSSCRHQLRLPRGYTSVDTLYEDMLERYLELQVAPSTR